MLQFIASLLYHAFSFPRFQYISCCSLSQCNRCFFCDRDVSIHLMLQFIQMCITNHRAKFLVSIHLMLQFISQPLTTLNTGSNVSIHLMLQFITKPAHATAVQSAFQYISCCSLSSIKQYSYRIVGSFNTSHVVVYHFATYVVINNIRFQYISCCSLSYASPIYKHQPHTFQYISCCSLSLKLSINKSEKSVFQYISCCSLSLLLLQQRMPEQQFQYISCCSLSISLLLFSLSKYCFNTSHVVVYRSCDFFRYFWDIVSIHLMLQFIKILIFHYFSNILFQYISCCSLSCLETGYGQSETSFNTSHVVVYPYLHMLLSHTHNCFNTSHVVVYPYFFLKKLLTFMFQYISCCSLSTPNGEKVLRKTSFNTSHVVVYLITVQKTENQFLSFNTSHVVVYRYRKIKEESTGASFNTSHVVVYPKQAGYISVREQSFNTSHVVVYPTFICVL